MMRTNVEMGLVACKLYLKLILWTLGYNLYSLFQGISWHFTGIHSHRRSMYTPGSHTAVHVCKIKARFKRNVMHPPFALCNFISTHECFASDDYLLKPNITLYWVNFTDAIFLESDENVEVTHSSCGSFLRVEQFKRARKVIVMPFEKFLEFGAKLGKPKSLVMLPNTGRCGSTLISKLLESTGKCVAMNELYAHSFIYDCIDNFEAERLDKVITSLINILCKPVDRPVETYVIKLFATETSLMPYIARSFPDAKFLFLYRDRASMVKSFYVIVKGVPMRATQIKFALKYKHSLFTFWKTSKIVMDLLGDFMPQNIIQYLSLHWLFNVHQYLDIHSKGKFQMMAAKDEDIVEDQSYAIRQIMEYCGVEYNDEQVKRVMSKNSQQGSPFDKNVIWNVRLDVPMSELMRGVNIVCETFGFVDLPENYVLPGTITHRSQ